MIPKDDTTRLSTPDFALLTTMRFDESLLDSRDNAKFASSSAQNTSFYMLSFHKDRLHQAARSFGWDEALATIEDTAVFENHLLKDIETWLRTHNNSNEEALRIRVTINQAGRMNTTITGIAAVDTSVLFPDVLSYPLQSDERPQIHRPWKVYVASTSTEPSPFTRYKTTERSAYNIPRPVPAAGGISLSSSSQQPHCETLLYNPSGFLMEGLLTSVYVYNNGNWVTPHISSGCQDGTTRRWALERQLCSEAEIPVQSLSHRDIIWLSNGVRGFFPGIVIRGG